MVFRLPTQREMVEFAWDVVGITLGDIADKYLTARFEQYFAGFGRLATGVAVGLFGPILAQHFIPQYEQLQRILRLAGAAVAAEWVKAKLPGGTSRRIVVPKTSQRVFVPPAKPRRREAVLW